jgi:DNA excision repair protein ERCC-3
MNGMNKKTMQLLTVLPDGTLLFESDRPGQQEIREVLTRIAILEQSPAYLERWRITDLSLWSAAAAGMNGEEVITFLKRHSKIPPAPALVFRVRETMGRFGRIRLEPADGGRFRLTTGSDEAFAAVIKRVGQAEEESGKSLLFPLAKRGEIRQICLEAGFPALDVTGCAAGERLNVKLRTDEGKFRLRDYQERAVSAFCSPACETTGGGVIVLPCGAGKTVVGIGVMARLGKATLILAPHAVSARQWVREILDKTTLTEAEVGEYTAEVKQVRPVTVTTYQMMTYRTGGQGPYRHQHLFSERDWGLVIYDEVHLLPAPVFRTTAGLQAARRLGLTATLVREDGREGDVFSLIGPKVYDEYWKNMEQNGWIAEVTCTEIRVPFGEEERICYKQASPRERYRLAAENPAKEEVVSTLLTWHKGEKILVIGHYLRQLKAIAARHGLPLIDGTMPMEQREIWYERFRKGEISALVVSRVANLAVDLPDASVAIQVSGTYGSRQEEAQRLGRVLRPKGEKEAKFYHIVTAASVDEEIARKRQRFLVQQGYRYHVNEWGRLP